MMEPETPIECLKAGRRAIKKDIEWYNQKNKPGVNFSDEYRKQRISELKPYIAMYDQAIKRLKDSGE